MRLTTLINEAQAGREGATPLVIAHGLFGSGRNWASLAKRFAASRRVIAVDLRNHGDSPWSDEMDYPAMAADLLETIAAEIGGPALILGHSMGGKTAMAAALSAPQAVAGLIVADIAPIAYAHSHAPFLAAMRAIDLSAITRRSQADPLLAEAIPEPPLRAFILQNLSIENGAARWRINIDAIDAEMPRLTGWPDALSPSAGARYDGPALFYHGGASDYVPDSAHGPIDALFPHNTRQAMPGAGHWLHAENPNGFFETVEAWLAAAAP